MTEMRPMDAIDSLDGILESMFDVERLSVHMLINGIDMNRLFDEEMDWAPPELDWDLTELDWFLTELNITEVSST
ncbi:hypothetical protein CHUAL_004043 [Chamberlinius hualienensis]